MRLCRFVARFGAVALVGVAVDLAQAVEAVGQPDLPAASVGMPRPLDDGRPPATGAGNPAAEQRLADTLLEGLIIDDTVTPRGRDFHRAFVDAWREIDMRARYTVSVREQPSPRHGSIVSIEHRGRQLARATLSPNRALAQGLAEQFASLVYERIVEAEAERLLFRYDDLAPEEF